MSNQAPAKDQPSLIGRYLPGVSVLRGYQRGWLRGDLLTGVTVAAYLVPQVMAYAEVAGLPAIAGLWAVAAPLVVYAILGFSRQLSIGPESSTALMTAAAVTVLVAGDQQNYAATAAALALAVGAVCLYGIAVAIALSILDLLRRIARPHDGILGYVPGMAGMHDICQHRS